MLTEEEREAAVKAAIAIVRRGKIAAESEATLVTIAQALVEADIQLKTEP